VDGHRWLHLLPPSDFVALVLQAACDGIGVRRIWIERLKRASKQSNDESDPATGGSSDRHSWQSSNHPRRCTDRAAKCQPQQRSGCRVRAPVNPRTQRSLLCFLPARIDFLLSNLLAIHVELLIRP
jgi:hypothetical protein